MLLKLLSAFSSESRQLKAARAALDHLAEVLDARVSVRLWDGSLVPLGRNVEPGYFASVRGPGVIGALLRRPALDTFVRLYAAGQIEFHGGDLIDFINVARLDRSRDRARKLRKLFLLRNAMRFLFAPAEAPRTDPGWVGDDSGRDQSRRNNTDFVRFHYDLGNDFYRLFLDPEMQYSCAYFTDWGHSLEQAQRDKIEMTCRKLRLKPGEKLLDVGCGWGGLICHAARAHGVLAHGITVSQAQFDFVREKVRRLGLEGRVTVELADYSAVGGTYDKVVSVGMYEHVGVANYPAYFAKLHSLLRDRGILLNHGITRSAKKTEKAFHRRRPEHKFITKYIFPGGELDHVGHTCEVLEATGFEVHDVENWREHYARTTAAWCKRLTARREEAVRLVGPERYNLWVAYLAGFSLAFADGKMRIHQVVASKWAKRVPSELPPTRADLYRAA